MHWPSYFAPLIAFGGRFDVTGLIPADQYHRRVGHGFRFLLPPFPGLVACTAKKASYAPEKSRDQTLRPLVVPRFDCHPLASRPILMDNNARPHRARRVQDYLQQEATLLAKLRCQNVVTT